MEKKLYAGFSRTDITPLENNLPLSGYGAVDLRRSTMVLDPMHANLLCLGEDGVASMLLITCDLIGVDKNIQEEVRKRVSKVTGLPEGRILMGGTHSHAVPALFSKSEETLRYLPYLFSQIEKAAPLAVADLRPAEIKYGSTEVGRPGFRMNFCRHYKLARVELREGVINQNIEYCGDNANSLHAADKEHYRYVGHAQEVDPNIQVIRLCREDADDIIMVNFQAHATITGGAKKTVISSDYPGALRKRVEELIPGTKCIYYNGACGNINPSSRMTEDSMPGLTFGNCSHYGYGAVLAAHVYRINLHLVDSESQDLDFCKRTITLQHDHTKDHLVEKAQIIAKRFAEIGPGNQEILELCDRYGFNSAYQCNAIIAKAKRSPDEEVEINAVRIGDCGMAISFGEYFDDLGRYIKSHSPFRLTFMKCYSGGDGTYFPSFGSPDNSYERDITRFTPGSGEILAGNFVEMLTEMKEK